jgi:hypothetical protein
MKATAYPFQAVWVGTPIRIESTLSASEARRRLLAPSPGQNDGFDVRVWTTGKADELRMIVLQPGRSSGFQRFLRCRVRPNGSGTGSLLEGELRTRRSARWFMNYVLAFLGLICFGSLVIAVNDLIHGQASAALGQVVGSLIVLLFLASALGMANIGIRFTASNEAYLREWLARRLAS